MADTRKARYNKRREALKTERKTWQGHWEELSEYIMPRLGRFSLDKTNRGEKKNHSIIDNTATVAARVLASGLMSGASSPARPWFRIGTADKDLRKSGEVKVYLDYVEELMYTILARSNVYNMLHASYEELGVFGTDCMLIEEDFNDVIRAYTYTAGEYMIAMSDRLIADTAIREARYTVRQLATWFGEQSLSQRARNQLDKGNYHEKVDVTHIIEPNEGRDVDSPHRTNMPYRSVWYENDAKDDLFLREGGFHDFPVLASRWDVTGTDTYGRSPGMVALGDVKQLQTMQLRKSQGIDKMTNPPMNAPWQLKNSPITTLPGGINFVDASQGSQTLAPTYQVSMPLNELSADISMVQQRIRDAFYTDLFMMMLSSDRRSITAREVDERHEEKLIMLGPVLERLHNEKFNRLIDRLYGIMVRGNLLPPPPRDLQGQTLKVEYISALANAQQAIGLGALERTIGFGTSLAQFDPSVLDKLNMDEVMDEYGTMAGVSPKVIRENEQANAIRQQRQAAMQQQQQAAALQVGVDAAEKLSNTDMDKPSALKNLAQNLTGQKNG